MFGLDIKKLDAEYREMALQRKEENRIFFSRYLDELVKERNTRKKIIESESQEHFELTESEYLFTGFKNRTFGRDNAQSSADYLQVSGVKFYYCEFQNCSFSNITFRDCIFAGCSFKECYSMGRGIMFENCSFMKCIPGKNSIDDMAAVFEACELSAVFHGCDMTGVMCFNTHFYSTRFIEVNLYDAVFLDCGFDIVRICDSDLRSAKLINPKVNDFSFEDDNRTTKVNENTFLGIVNFSRKEKMEINSTAEAYRSLSRLFEKNDVVENSSEYFYLFKKTEMYRLTGLSRIKSFLSHIICGYGERPSFSLICAVVLVLVCGTLYMFMGVSYNNEVISFLPGRDGVIPPLGNLAYWYHFSLVTFTTVGYGNVTPVGGSVIVSGTEMVLGVILTGIWVSTLVRKMTR